MAHGQETGSGKPALRQALPARGLELDLIFGLPSGPAAWNVPQQRPHTCQHPTTCHTAPEDFSCSSRGVHTCRRLPLRRAVRALGRRPRGGAGERSARDGTEGGAHWSGFECRKCNRAASGKLSAHALGLAVDVVGFELASGARLFVTESQDSPKVTLLSALRRASCGWFTTILGPGTDAMHADHWHLDIDQHGSSASYRICQ